MNLPSMLPLRSSGSQSPSLGEGEGGGGVWEGLPFPMKYI